MVGVEHILRQLQYDLGPGRLWTKFFADRKFSAINLEFIMTVCLILPDKKNKRTSCVTPWDRDMVVLKIPIY